MIGVHHYEVTAFTYFRYIYCNVSDVLQEFDCVRRGAWNWLVIIDASFLIVTFVWDALLSSVVRCCGCAGFRVPARHEGREPMYIRACSVQVKGRLKWGGEHAECNCEDDWCVVLHLFRAEVGFLILEVGLIISTKAEKSVIFLIIHGHHVHLLYYHWFIQIVTLHNGLGITCSLGKPSCCCYAKCRTWAAMSETPQKGFCELDAQPERLGSVYILLSLVWVRVAYCLEQVVI